MPVGARDIHVQSLATSSALSEYYVPNLITPHEVIRILNTVNVRFMLLRAHGIGGWTQTPRHRGRGRSRGGAGTARRFRLY